MKTLRMGLIGGGRWAATHRKAILAAEQRLEGVCVASPEKRRELQAAWDVPVTTDLNEFLAADLDAVIIVSPNDLHAAHSIAALRAGKHVLVEKPMALTVEDCHAMEEAARQAERLLVPAMQMRLFGHFARLHAVLPSLGPLRWIELNLWRKPHSRGSGTWRQDNARRGALWLEEPIHYLDLLGHFMGTPPQSITAWAPANDVLQARLTWPQGAAGQLDYCLRGSGHAVRVRAVGDEAAAELTWEGAADMDEHPQVRLTRSVAGVAEELDVPQQCGHAFDGPRLLTAFVQACQGATPKGLLKPAEGTQAVAWALAAASAASGN